MIGSSELLEVFAGSKSQPIDHRLALWLTGAGGGPMKEKNSWTMLQPGKTRSRTTVKSLRHQYGIVLTEYREP